MGVVRAIRASILPFEVLLSIAIFAGFGPAEDKAAEKIKVAAKLYEVQPDHFETRIDLGKLPIGQTVECLITLTNATTKDVLLLDPKLTCNCLAMEIVDEPIAPGESIDCMIKVSLPARPNKSQWNQLVSFDRNPSTGASLARFVLSGELKGLFVTDKESIQFMISETAPKGKAIKQKLFVSVSEPVAMEHLQFTGAGLIDLFSVRGKAVPRGTTAAKGDWNGEVEISILPEHVPAEGVVATLLISDKVTEQQRAIMLAAIERPDMTIAPSRVRFNVDEDEQIATAMIIRSSGKEKSAALVEAKLNGVPLKVTSKPLGMKAMRLTLSLTSEKFQSAIEGLEKDEKPEIIWRVTWGESSASLKTPIVYRSK